MSASSNQDPRGLLHLPSEIRNQIWRYVLGDRHIRVTSKRPPHVPTSGLHPICHPFNIESIDLSIRSTISPRYTNDLAFCIRFADVTRISQFNNPFHSTRTFEKAESLYLLLVNRQLAHEAGFVFYSTNLFAFHLECCFREWITLIAPTNRSYIKSILIEDKYHSGTSMKEWMSNMPWLPGVNSIGLYSVFQAPNETALNAMNAAVLRQLTEIKCAAVKNGSRMKRIEMVMDVDMEEWQGRDLGWEELVKFMKRLGKRRDKVIKDIDRVVELQEARASRGGIMF